MKTLTIRVEDELFNTIDKHRGTKSKNEFYRIIIEYYLQQFVNKNEDNLNNDEDNLNNDREELFQVYRQELEHLKQENLKLLELLHESHALQAQSQKLLPEKSWWQFWKK